VGGLVAEVGHVPGTLPTQGTFLVVVVKLVDVQTSSSLVRPQIGIGTWF
jgi:hypothetical protein